jgi:hypothetical protein
MAAGRINVYDIRKECIGPLCYDFSRLQRYIDQEEVRDALGVGDRQWTECDPKVHADLMGDWMIDVRTVNQVHCGHVSTPRHGCLCENFVA